MKINLCIKATEIQHLEYLAKQLHPVLKKKPNKIKRLVIKTRSIGNLNAVPISLFFGTAKIAFARYTTTLCTAIADIIEKIIPRDKEQINVMPSLEKHFLEDITQIKKNIFRDKFFNFEQVLFTILGKPVDKALLLKIEKIEIESISTQIRDSIILFIMGHECKHIQEDHAEYNVNIVDNIEKNWRQELDADNEGCELMNEVMIQKYPYVTNKAQFNFGFEIFFQCLEINELLSLIFKEEKFNGTHPDAGTRLRKLREKVCKNINEMEYQKIISAEPKIKDETWFNWEKRIIEFISVELIIEVSNIVFDTYEKKLSHRILYWASIIDEEERLFQNFSFWKSCLKCIGKSGLLTAFSRAFFKTNRVLEKAQELSEKQFIQELKIRVYGLAETFDSNINGLEQWKSGNFTKAVIEFARENYGDHFKKILAKLYMHEYEKNFNRMKLKIGQQSDFDAGVAACFENEDYKSAIDFFESVYEREIDMGNSLAGFALGYAYSMKGKEYMNEGNYECAKECFGNTINISPIAQIETFEWLGLTLEELGQKETSTYYKATFNILSSAKTSEQRFKEWLKKYL